MQAPSPDRRSSPSIWQPDWHVLRQLAKALRAALADEQLRLKGARVIDFGCGTRPYEDWFTAAGATYHGADLDAAAEIAVRADGTLSAGNGEYDLVASIQVLEHVWDVGVYLREARRVLKPRGWLLLATHGSWLYHPHPHDYRRWTAEGLRREVQAQGFTLERLHPVVGPLAWTTVFRSLGAAHALSGVPLLGRLLAPAFAAAFNLRAWMEDCVTPLRVTADNACVYVCLFRRDA
jgi:SAM-dependent methyltransferase